MAQPNLPPIESNRPAKPSLAPDETQRPKLVEPTPAPITQSPIDPSHLQKAREQYFVVRIGEQYISDEKGTMVTPYFKSAYRFKIREAAEDISVQTGGQLYQAAAYHTTAKRLLIDRSPL